MNRKEYTLPNGKKAVFEYDVMGIGTVTLECMDMLMAMIADRPQGEWIKQGISPYEGIQRCSLCDEIYNITEEFNFCPNCGAKMKGTDDE